RRKGGAVTHQTRSSGELACRIEARNATACRQLDNLITPASEEWIEGDQKRLGSLLDEHHECGFKLAVSAGAQDLQLASPRVCRVLGVFDLKLGIRRGRIYQQGDGPCLGGQLVQHVHLLCPQIPREEGHPASTTT